MPLRTGVVTGLRLNERGVTNNVFAAVIRQEFKPAALRNGLNSAEGFSCRGCTAAWRSQKEFTIFFKMR